MTVAVRKPRVLKLVMSPIPLRWVVRHGRSVLGIGRGGPHDEAEHYAREYAEHVWPERRLEILIREHERCNQCAVDVVAEWLVAEVGGGPVQR